MATKHIDTNGLLYYSTLIRQALASKINTGDADKNVITGITLNGTTLSPVNKIVNIPLATTSAAGALSSTDKSHLDELYEDATNYAYLSDIGVVTASTTSSSPALNDYWKDNNVLKRYDGSSWETVVALKLVRVIGSGNSTEGIYLYIPNVGFTEIGTSSSVAEKVADVTVNGTSIVNSTTKVASLTIDSTASDNSNNPISSNAVYDINTTLTNAIEKLGKRMVILSAVGASAGNDVTGYWYDTQSDLLKYRETTSDSWAQALDLENNIVIGYDESTNPVTAYVFVYGVDVLKIADSSAVTAALALKAPLASPAFTGTPTAPTASSGTNNTQIATTAFVQAAISAAVTGSFKFVNSLPATGEEGYIYLVPHTHSGSSTNANPDVKDEYIWNTSASPAQWELIGNTDINLSGYWSKSELETATNAEVLAAWENSANA